MADEREPMHAVRLAEIECDVSLVVGFLRATWWYRAIQELLAEVRHLRDENAEDRRKAAALDALQWAIDTWENPTLDRIAGGVRIGEICAGGGRALAGANLLELGEALARREEAAPHAVQ